MYSRNLGFYSPTIEPQWQAQWEAKGCTLQVSGDDKYYCLISSYPSSLRGITGYVPT
jgi:hypothetical protein